MKWYEVGKIWKYRENIQESSLKNSIYFLERL